jgi:hypothetical protein
MQDDKGWLVYAGQGLPEALPRRKAETYGQCRACGGHEVLLLHPYGTVDLSSMGESPAYPVGYGCELCS